ncbi:hypothetical protein BCR33DRAFT_853091 [Rhizoclosmatium globosum]|uniref:Proteasome assembly chaperone 3 n=1 Tax=Rhizoclosmatium globosum TaxID=329046 RepID=A0A1Y2BZ23_9FUNG|nr:hypothetical protein BCR33DRAFT_853091 [Rhizoclosmatium globosum]|eukprot:ORY39976.1 hypothetical protein BCR33DRAFT_853091 [Rhizoclosmatium globosum]
MTHSSESETVVAQHTIPFTEGTHVHIQIIQMGSSVFVWIGATQGDAVHSLKPTGQLAALAFAATTRFNNGAAIGSTLIAAKVDDASEGIAKRIAARTKMNVFVSCDLPSEAADLVVFSERHTVKLLKELEAKRNASHESTQSAPSTTL